VRALLERERARADRNGQEFSLVVFTQDSARPRDLWRLARTVGLRCRLTDEVGWFDEGRVCAILPDTSNVGAWCFARGVCQSSESYGVRPACMVFTYPSTWAGDDDKSGGAPRRRGAEAAAAPGNTQAPPGLSLTHQRDMLMPFVAAGMREELDADAGRAAALEPMLVRPLPWWKRLTDILGAGVGLLLAAPLMLVIAAAIKLTSRGPVLFTQKRAGLGGRPFTIFKFRTMGVDAERQREALKHISEQDGPAFKLKDDPRVTRVGKVLRKTSLDELPQLLNVLLGTMSLVGPRPLPLVEADACETWHRRRLDVTPGLTCIWQVEGRSKVAFDDWIRMDMRYIRRRGFLKDLKILFRTIPAVLLRRGAH